MAKVRGAVVVDKEGCKGCGICVDVCPQDVLELNMEVNSRGYHYSYMKKPRSMYRMFKLWGSLPRHLFDNLQGTCLRKDQFNL